MSRIDFLSKAASGLVIKVMRKIRITREKENGLNAQNKLSFCFLSLLSIPRCAVALRAELRAVILARHPRMLAMSAFVSSENEFYFYICFLRCHAFTFLFFFLGSSSGANMWLDIIFIAFPILALRS